MAMPRMLEGERKKVSGYAYFFRTTSQTKRGGSEEIRYEYV
jgi:hypothetical protein